MKKRRTNNKVQRNVFELLAFRYFPFWPLFVGLSILMSGAAWAYLTIAEPVYEITANLLINDEKKGVEDSQMVESLNILTSKKIVENEIEVMKSRALMENVTNRLQLCSPVLEVGVLTDHTAYTTCPVSVELEDITQITEDGRIEFHLNDQNTLVHLNGKEYPINSWIDTPHGKIRFVRNAYLQRPGNGPFYVSLIDYRKIMNRLLSNLKVQSSNKLSTVISLSFKDENPIRGKNILNALIEEYDKIAVNDKNNLAANTLKFVEERIMLVEQELDSLERSIEEYKSTRGVVDLSEQGRVFLQNVSDNDQRLSELDIQMSILNKIENYVIESDSTAKIVPSTLGVNDERLSSLIQKLYEAEVEYDRLRNTTAENNPILLSLQNEIENLRPGVLENIRSQKSSLNASRANLATTNSKYSSMLESIPKKERELLEANRQHLIKNNVYTFLLQKREETALSSASTVSDTRLIDKAESSIQPVSPKKILAYPAALAISLVLGISYVTYKELLNNKVLFRSEIEQATKTPIAAEIWDSRTKEYVVIDNLKKPFLTEQFIQLRAAIGLYGGSSKKTLMVTSALAGEGKSFISTNFAISLAGADKKVLLIDLDLRNPRVSRLFNASAVKGVSEFLNGDVPIERVVRRTVTPNLFLISAGNKRSRATQIILDGNVRPLFARLRELFDYIIVDTPPVNPVIDAYVISPYCDVTLFVLRHGKTPKAILNQLDETINLNEALKNTSIVFNGVKSRGFGMTKDGGYGYGQGYGYSYGYSDQGM